MKKLVACLLENGSCTYVMVCKNVDEKEYQKLVNETLQHKEKELREKNDLIQRLSSLENEVSVLKNEIKVLKGEE